MTVVQLGHVAKTAALALRRIFNALKIRKSTRMDGTTCGQINVDTVADGNHMSNPNPQPPLEPTAYVKKNNDDDKISKSNDDGKSRVGNLEGQIRTAPSNDKKKTVKLWNEMSKEQVFDCQKQVLIEAHGLQFAVIKLSETGADCVARQLARFLLTASRPKEAANNEDDETAHYVLQLLRASDRLLHSGAKDCDRFHAAITEALDVLRMSSGEEGENVQIEQFREARWSLLTLIKRPKKGDRQAAGDTFLILLGRLFIGSSQLNEHFTWRAPRGFMAIVSAALEWAKIGPNWPRIEGHNQLIPLILALYPAEQEQQ